MFRTISMQQLEQLLDGERTFTLLDVREQKEYEAGHLLGAVNLPYEQLDEVEAEITKDRPVVIYCAYGGQSLLAARELAGRGECTGRTALLQGKILCGMPGVKVPEEKKVMIWQGRTVDYRKKFRMECLA